VTRALLAAAVLLLAGPPAPAVVIDHGPRTARRVALTFDADMTSRMLAELRTGRVRSWYDARIVRYLRATRTPATIFLTGLWTRTYPRVVRSLARDPLFELENHSWDHAAWTPGCYGLPALRSARRKRAEVLAAAREITGVTGREPRYFRFPGGCHGDADVRLVARAGEQVIGWDVVSGDAFQPDPAPIAAQVLRGVRPGSIVVLHLVGAPNAPATYAALKAIVPALRQHGYRFVTVERLLRGAR
jgi:peptidoglycan-N-acetylglucosamine deacetylase